MKWIVRMLFAIIFLAVGILLLVFLRSPGTAVPIPGNHPRSISTIEQLQIGGVEQELLIRAIDSTKTVLLFLHGGPGYSGYHFLDDSKHNLEQEFVLAYWEQRGAGKSYSKSIPTSTLTIDQFLSDIEEITQYLKQRFNKQKIILLGHSWGAFIGVLAVDKYPQHYHSYIGIGQVCNSYKSEMISWKWVNEEAKKRNDTEALAQLAKLEFPDSLASGQTWFEYMDVQRLLVAKYGGAASAGAEFRLWPIYKDIIFNLPEYTVSEKLGILDGNYRGLSNLQDDVAKYNFNEVIDSLQIPVFLMHGKHDHLVEFSVAKEFYNQLKAPEKQWHAFEKSAHRPFFDETAKFNKIILDIASRYDD